MSFLKYPIAAVFLLSLFFATAKADDKDDDVKAVVHTEEEAAIISMLDSLTGRMFENRFVLPLVTKAEDDTMRMAKQDMPRFADSIIIQNLLKIESEIPLAFNDRVRRYIEVYSLERRPNVEIMLGLSEIYFPLFEEHLDRRNLPHHLKYLPVIESALNANAVSKAGATGLWQIMYSTGRMLGLEINSYIDERRDPIRSTEAALDYLQRLHNIYGDWLLVIAAYNCGPGNVNKAIARAGGERNFWRMQHYLPAETRGYVPAFIAAMYVFMHYEDYQYKALLPKFANHPTDTIIVKNNISLEHLAEQLQMDKSELEFLNPALKKKILPVTANGYALKLPVSKVAQYEMMKDSIFARMPDFEEILLERSKVTNEYGNVSSAGTSKLYYTVKAGDNLGYISEWYDCSVQDLRRWNGIRGNTINIGQKIAVYVPKSRHSDYVEVNRMSSKEKQEWKASGSKVAVKKDSDCNCVYYKVQDGDTLWDISQKYRTSVHDIRKHNNIPDNNIKPGMVLKIL